jgi:hypothetical protein
MRRLLYIGLISTLVNANNILYIDSDLDGVVDIYDKCLNTPFEYEVKKDGCPKDEYLNHYEFKSSYSISKHSINSSNLDYTFSNLSLYIESQKYIFGVSSGYLDIEYIEPLSNTKYLIQGYSDTYIELGYKLHYNYLHSITLTTKLSTSNNDALTSGENDYSLETNFQKSYENISVFGSIGYNYTNDTTINYNNYFDFSLGVIGLINDDFYGVNIVYSEPIIKDETKDIDSEIFYSISIINSYQMRVSYITNLDTLLSNRDDSIALKISYSF